MRKQEVFYGIVITHLIVGTTMGKRWRQKLFNKIYFGLPYLNMHKFMLKVMRIVRGVGE